MMRRTLLAAAASLPFAGSALAQGQPKRVGSIRRHDSALDALIDVDSPIEVLATGYHWAEGPVWVPAGDFLLFNDVPQNMMWRWCKKYGAQLFLKPSGLAGAVPEGIREAGANGLAIDAQGQLILADSGTRVVSRVTLPGKARTVLADRFEGKRFNSPNDVSVHKSGAIYFTDPPYGLKDGDTSPLKELDINGVYRLAPDRGVALIDGSHKRPNGVDLSPDGKTLYVALSDEARPQVLAYSLGPDGMATGAPRLFRDMAADLAAGLPGLPDGMTVHRDGPVFASGPGGIHVLSPEGKALGLISTGKATANCAFGEDGKSLFLTSSDMLARVRIRTRGI